MSETDLVAAGIPEAVAASDLAAKEPNARTENEGATDLAAKEPHARSENEAAIEAAPQPRGDSESTADESLAELTEAQLEALLFVAERPLTRREIATIAGVDRATVDARLGDLEVGLARRGVRLILNEERVELATAPEAGRLIARYVGVDAIRLSPAALETLAIVAYRQPVTKGAVERIRGVDSDYTIRSLLHRRLIVELGRSDSPGRPYLYGTGFEFLERFGIASLEELPPLEADIAARLAETGSHDAGSNDEERTGSPTGTEITTSSAAQGAASFGDAHPRHRTDSTAGQY